MSEIVDVWLYQSKLVAKVSIEHFELVKDRRWHCHPARNKNYARLSLFEGGIYMHHLILPQKEGFEVDHRDWDGLNNVDSNLRYATQSQNMANRPAQVNNTSGYKGVSYNKLRKKWDVRIQVEGNTRYKGYYETKEEAALKYNEASLRYFGEFGYQNIIKELNEVKNV